MVEVWVRGSRFFFDSVQTKALKGRWGPVEGGSGMEIGPNVERNRKQKEKKERA